MVSVLVSSAVDHGLSPDQVKLKSIFCCISAKHIALRRKSQLRVAPNQNNVSKWGDMSIPGLLFQ